MPFGAENAQSMVITTDTARKIVLRSQGFTVLFWQVALLFMFFGFSPPALFIAPHHHSISTHADKFVLRSQDLTVLFWQVALFFMFFGFLCFPRLHIFGETLRKPWTLWCKCTLPVRREGPINFLLTK